jgi:hypothetical protein
LAAAAFCVHLFLYYRTCLRLWKTPRLFGGTLSAASASTAWLANCSAFSAANVCGAGVAGGVGRAAFLRRRMVGREHIAFCCGCAAYRLVRRRYAGNIYAMR